MDPDKLTADRSWPAELMLKHPVKVGSEAIASLTFRRGRLGDLKGIRVDGIPPVDQLLLVASRMCGQPVSVLERLDEDDGQPVLEIALGFFARCLGAGKTP